MQWLLRLASAAVFCAVIASGALADAAKQVDVHDPAMASEGGTYYLYSTGPGIPFYSSKDMVHWVARGRVFATEPVWARSVNAHFNGHVWAPDITFRDGRYYLYYAVSSPGVNDSAIGLTVNKTLDPDSPDYKWEDHGIVLRSIAGRDLWNAIDPNVIVDEAGAPWMVFGSFWSGIKLVKLNKTLTGLAEPEEWHALAKRERSVLVDDRSFGPAEIEGPFLFRRGDYYYLFVSWGKCCIGKNSTYRIVVGRSKTVTGPYLDKRGRNMALGGGSPLLAEDKKWAGWGGQGVYDFGGDDYVVFHAYENADNDFHRLKIAKITWDKKQWPEVDKHVLDTYRGLLAE
ncbi:MAG TPA: family 43 glycosylhydrolase [Mycobacterium sp.]|nr:family 43 glycosylhydrolase [Mycobacterium sp.]